MTKAFGYLRVSGKNQEQGDGFPRQRATITAYARKHDIRIVQWFTERAIPGKTEWDDRPAWVDMVSQLDGTETILIERLDRLARDLMVQEHIIADLRKRHVTLISAMEPDLCIDDPSRKLLRQIMGAIAEYDRAMIVAKMAAARKRMKEETGRCEGQKPFGHHASELPAMQFMRAHRALGRTYAQIAESLNQYTHQTRNGKPWIGATVRKILSRE